MADLQETLSSLVQDGIPTIINNSSAIFNVIISGVLILCAFLWLYCGVIIFIDSKKRFRFTSMIPNFILLVVGAIFGPVALIIYYVIRPKKSQDELDFVKVEHKFYYHQASKVVDCLECGAYVLEDHLYCTNCGTQNRFKCESCDAVTDYDDLFCHNCGNSFDGRYEKIVADLEDKSDDAAVKDEDALELDKKPEKIAEENSKPKKDKSGSSLFDKLILVVDKFDAIIKKAIARLKSLLPKKPQSTKTDETES